MLARFQYLAAQIEGRYGPQTVPASEELLLVADILREVCARTVFDEREFPEAKPGEGILHALAVSPTGGASIYLVSDGVGVSSPPHGHLTWSVIVGIRGVERNTIFRRAEDGERVVEAVSSKDVGPGQVLTLSASEIHATAVAGGQPRFHVHLYGSSLSSLPPFASRCFEARGAV